jgi:glyoxylase-like metal-dependent hydrolase (beta-lactamase superfamily II)
VTDLSGSTYEAFALKYGTTSVSKSAKYYRYDTYGEPDATLGLDFFFWVLRNQERTVLVDCGYDDERTAARGYYQDAKPLQLLSRLDVTATEVDHVVLSHMHFDHIGNVDLFPNATFSVARAELEFWTGPLADRNLLAHSGDPRETQMVVDRLRDGRVLLVDGEQEVMPGLTLTPVRGHTPGQLVTQARTKSGQVVLASDAIHFYEEMERDRPYWVFHDLEGMYHGFELLREMAATPGTHIVAGHDPAVMTRFAPVNDRIVDLTELAD